MSSPVVVGVYGSLRRGASANGLLNGAKYLGSDKVKGNLFNLGAYPGLLLCRAEKMQKEVVVDLYQLPEEKGMLKTLDRYESYFPDREEESLYTRKTVVTLEGCMKIYVYVYCGRCDARWEVVPPDWIEFQQQKK